MLDDPYRFDRPDLLASSSAQRFEPGSPNTMGQAALYASLGLFCDVGLVEVEARILANTAQIIDALSQISAVKLVSHTDIQRRSGIVSFLPGDTDPDIFCRNMASKKVFVAVRGQAIRLSPHFYQAGQPIERLLGMLEDEILKL